LLFGFYFLEIEFPFLFCHQSHANWTIVKSCLLCAMFW
jgi:hypothetical protein